LKFYASVRLDIRRSGSIKGPDNSEIGNRVKVKVVKNKVSPPFQVAEFDILFNEGISRIGSLIDLGVELGIVEKKGTWFSFQNHRLGQGRESAREELKKNPSFVEEIERLILAKIKEGKEQTTPIAKEEVLV
jgi:recombination protein RecA